MRARELRRDGTVAEKRLRLRLRNRELGLKFRRQSPIVPYFADFCCKEAQLIIELDGDQHASEQGLDHDAQRTAFLT
jgi:very-short-patch-repair endonuclease